MGGYYCNFTPITPSGMITWFTPKWSRVQSLPQVDWTVKHWVCSPITAGSIRFVDTQRLVWRLDNHCADLSIIELGTPGYPETLTFQKNKKIHTNNHHFSLKRVVADQYYIHPVANTYLETPKYIYSPTLICYYPY